MKGRTEGAGVRQLLLRFLRETSFTGSKGRGREREEGEGKIEEEATAIKPSRERERVTPLTQSLRERERERNSACKCLHVEGRRWRRRMRERLSAPQQQESRKPVRRGKSRQGIRSSLLQGDREGESEGSERKTGEEEEGRIR